MLHHNKNPNELPRERRGSKENQGVDPWVTETIIKLITFEMYTPLCKRERSREYCILQTWLSVGDRISNAGTGNPSEHQKGAKIMIFKRSENAAPTRQGSYANNRQMQYLFC